MLQSPYDIDYYPNCGLDIFEMHRIKGMYDDMDTDDITNHARYNDNLEEIWTE
ncbi:hypothetical protein [Haladaptatus sp. DFWS20]|uniref:hypothetical protein n=1 Tax=Haladaptatus sp. DFWS20 TaxID=3403467 RepID=UPI003EBEDF34